jgi:benzoate/toluate 1,2-dioxygenase reductase subunit
MVPESDCVIAVPASSTACKTEQSRFAATVSKVEPHNDAAVVLELDVDSAAPVFLAGQYVNIDVPGSGQHRSYSFSSAPGQSKISFLIKRIPGGVMSTWLESAQPGNKVELTGPLGSFYLRAVERPLLFLAGGTGLAPFLSMLEVLARADSQQKIHLIYGVTRDLDLVQVDAIEAYLATLPNFTYTTVVADTDSTHPRKGWVTQHMPAETLNDGDVDVYLCGPPPMVDAVRKYFDDNGVKPNSFHYEKFTPNAAPRTA